MSESNTTYLNREFTVTELHDVTLNTTNTPVPDGCIVLGVVNVLGFIPWDNPQSLISLQVERWCDKIITASLILLSLIGVPTNIINMIAFYKQGIKERINFCVFSLAVLDFLSVVYVLVCHADRIYLPVMDLASRGVMTELFIKYDLVGFYGLMYSSAFVTMVIVCERCFCVVSPLKSQRILKTRTTVVVIVTASLVITGAFFVVMLRWDVKCVFNPRTGTTSQLLQPRDFYLQNRRAIDILDGVVYGLVLLGIFDLAVAISTVITVVKLKRMASWREATSSGAMSTREVTLTRMLVGISILFVACTTPALCFRCAILVVPDLSLTGRQYNMFNLVGNLTKLTMTLNASVTFFIYYAMGSKYKETVKRMFRIGNTEKKGAAGLIHNVNSSKSDIEQ